LVEHTIRVVIIDDSRGEKCDARCGVDWSSKEDMALAEQRIKDRFGGTVRLEYLDLSKPSDSGRASELMSGIRDEGLSFPLLLVNGETRISGRFDIRQLLDVVEAEMELSYD
jgi:disulfide oxidoreductase YuzD